MTLARIGWRFKSPFTLVNDVGDEYVLTQSSPKLMKSVLKQAVRKKMEEYLARSWEASDAQFEGRTACADLLRQELKALQKRATLTPLQ